MAPVPGWDFGATRDDGGELAWRSADTDVSSGGWGDAVGQFRLISTPSDQPCQADFRHLFTGVASFYCPIVLSGLKGIVFLDALPENTANLSLTRPEPPTPWFNRSLEPAAPARS